MRSVSKNPFAVRRARIGALHGASGLVALTIAGLWSGAALAQSAAEPTTPPANQSTSTDGSAAVVADQGAPTTVGTPASPTPEPRAGGTGDAQGQEIVVTGSRIARRDYSANSPILTANEELLKQTGTQAIEQNLNKLPEFTPTNKNPTQGGDIQPTATNTPGAATVSLRGIGANRNLVLLDGRRATPSNATGVVDINTIPTVAIDRVEIISGGASSTYGADAVGGVVNFILKKNFSGLELDAQNSISQRGDGNEYTISGIMGANFSDGRGNVTFAMSTNKRGDAVQIDRPWFRKLYSDPNVGGNQFFPPFGGFLTAAGNLPTVAALNANIRGATFTTSPTATNIFTDFSGNAFTGFGGSPVNVIPGESGFTNVDGLQFKKGANGQLQPNRLNTLLQLPLTRYNAYARGTYELADWINVFGQAVFSKVNTSTVQEPAPITSGWTALIDPSINRGVIPRPLLNILDSRPNPNAPFQLVGYLPFPRTSNTDVYTYNLVAGVQGKIPQIGWTFELFGSRGESETTVIQRGFASLQRFTNIITRPNFGAGTSVTGNQGAPNFGFGAATATCTSGINLFNPGSISQDCLTAVGADIKTKSVSQQTVWEGDFQGPLFKLPAGEIRAALGASYRSNTFDFQNDTLTTQGQSFIEQAIGLYPSGNSSGKIEAKEAYGELLIPILSDLPFVKEFDLEVGGRYSHYNTTGTSWTYKILGDYQVNDWLRFRGGYNRAERTPNIAELFLAPQQTFAVSAGGDVCSTANGLGYSANPTANPANYQRAIALCGQLMERSGDTTADTQYYGVDYRTLTAASPSAVRTLVTTQQGVGASFVFPTLRGNADLEPETAKTITAGVVLSSPFRDNAFLNRLRLTVDYYNIKVAHAIGAQSPDIVQRQCFDPAFNPTYDPNSPFCAGVARNATGALGNLTETFLNNGRFRTSGIDVQLDWSFPVGPGKVVLNSVFNYLLNMKAAELPTDRLTNYTDTQGPTINGLDGSSYQYKILTTLGYNLGGTYLGVQWRHLPSIRSATAALVPTTPVQGVAKSYNLFNLIGHHALTRDIGVRFGVDNLFDKAPPRQGVNPAAVLPTLQGGSFDTNNYDVFGRRFYIGANVKF